MKQFVLFTVCIVVWIPGSYAIDPQLLKDEYVTKALSDVSTNTRYVYRFTRTHLTENGFSVVCNMEQANADKGAEYGFTNKPGQGLRIELRARAMVAHLYDGQPYYYNTGFVVIVKGGAVVKSFGVPDPWFLPWWTNSKTKIYLRDWSRGFKSDSLNFDLLTGDGFYFKEGSSNPDYILSRCRKIAKSNLPVYVRERVDKPES